MRAMKDGLNEAALNRIIKAFEALDFDFAADEFKAELWPELEQWELKERVSLIIAALQKYLPSDFNESAALLAQIPPIWDFGDKDDNLKGFAAWPLIDFVAVAGVEHPELALDTLETLTGLFSSEFAIRPFIEAEPERVISRMLAWCEHKDESVRRLASEGCRPRLPWGMQLKTLISDPRPIVPILNALIADSSLYVRRSVANNLNDISKDHPELVIAQCIDWRAQYKAADDELRERVEWVIKHATRSLVKAGHPASFPLLGYSAEPKVKVVGFELESAIVKVGQALEFTVTLEACECDQSFVLDFAIHYRKANGSLAAKVFKLNNCFLSQGETISIKKAHSFKVITTRKYYLGDHVLALHINGREIARKQFELEN